MNFQEYRALIWPYPQAQAACLALVGATGEFYTMLDEALAKGAAAPTDDVAAGLEKVLLALAGAHLGLGMPEAGLEIIFPQKDMTIWPKSTTNTAGRMLASAARIAVEEADRRGPLFRAKIVALLQGILVQAGQIAQVYGLDLEEIAASSLKEHSE